MNIVIRKLDKRFTGHRDFSHRVEFRGPTVEKALKYIEVRNWCWERLGPGFERDIFFKIKSQLTDVVWCWHTDTTNLDFCLYFQSEKELNFFTLKWSS